MRSVHILGSTGSIGTQCLEVVAANGSCYRVASLTAGGANLSLLARQVAKFRPERVGIASGDELDFRQCLAEVSGSSYAHSVDLLVGPDASAEVAARASVDDVVLNGITGGVGLGSTLAALRAGATLALANKESLVEGGPLVEKAMVRPGQIVPVDSEHSAIAQCLRSGVHERGLTSPVLTGRSEVSKLILTASGGPFRGASRKQLANVTVDQALQHPTWNMGPVVTINSSTLMNKALELIEAHLLFDVAPEDIIPVVHPQSRIHSAVRWMDGSTVMQSSPPSMKIPIALGLSWPERLCDVANPDVFDEPFALTFEPVDSEVFPALELARYAARKGEGTPAVMNAANEVCVDRFRRGMCGFLDIVDTVASVCEQYCPSNIYTVEDLDEVTRWACVRADELLGDSSWDR